jgi:hypothetical protein
MEGLGIEFRWGGETFSTRPVRTHPPIWPGHGVDHPPPIAEVKERVQLYIYSLSGSSWPVLEWILPLPYNSWLQARLGQSTGYIGLPLDKTLRWIWIGQIGSKNNAFAFHSGDVLFGPRLGHEVSWLTFPFFSSSSFFVVPPGKGRLLPEIMPYRFLIYISSVVLSWNAVWSKIVVVSLYKHE